MIRKPSADWPRLDDGAVVRTFRTAAAVATGTTRMARRGGHAAVGLICYFMAIVWFFAAIASGLTWSLASMIGIGALSAVMFWTGRRAFAQARAPSG